MATPPDFVSGAVLTAAQMNAVGLWRITGCTVTSSGGTAATASDGVINIGAGNTTITIANAFSSDYDNYVIVGSTIDFSGGGFGVRLALNGITTSGYYSSLLYDNYGGTDTGYSRVNNLGYMTVAFTSATDDTSFIYYIYGPNLAKRKTATFQMASESYMGTGAGTIANTTQATGFNLTVSSGSYQSGKIRVYGIRN